MDEKEIVLPNDTVPVVETVAETESVPVANVQPSAPVAEVVTFDNLYCSTCRVRLKDSQLMKSAIDYEINADGSSTSVPERYSLFCGTCQQFLGMYDPKAQKELSEMTRLRQEKENAKTEK